MNQDANQLASEGCCGRFFWLVGWLALCGFLGSVCLWVLGFFCSPTRLVVPSCPDCAEQTGNEAKLLIQSLSKAFTEIINSHLKILKFAASILS